MERLNDCQNSNYKLVTQESSNESTNAKEFPQIGNPKLCNFYSNNGFCKYGQNCKFLHQRKYFSSSVSQRKYETYKPNQKRDVPLKLPQRGKQITYASSFEYNSSEPTTPKNIQKRICRYYKAGHCEKGNNCSYSHNLGKNNLKLDVTASQNRKDVPSIVKIATSKKKSVPVCRFFRHGICQKGDQCKYYHNPRYQKENHDTTSNNENNLSENQSTFNNDEDVLHDTVFCSEFNTINSNNVENPVPSVTGLLDNHETLQELKHLNTNLSHDVNASNYMKISIQVPQNSRNFNLSTLTEDGLYQLRNTEITQLKKRFPKLEENDPCFSFDFEPTDPDWPFDVKTLHLTVTFPETYPLEVCDITVVSHMNYIPGVLLRFLNQNICDWLIEKHSIAIEQNQVVLVFRSFLKWFDRNLEDLFKSGLKKVTKDEVAQNIYESVQPENNSSSCENNPTDDLLEQDSSISATTPTAQEDLEKDRDYSPSRQKIEPTLPINLQMQGTKVMFTGLELVEGVAALSCKKLALTVHCSRCKTSCNKLLIPNKNTVLVCSKCSRNMECNFNPSILHQFSSVLGTIYLSECQASDVNLVECAFLVDCLSCAKQVAVDGLHYGQKQKLWCKFCNQKLLITIDSVKFQAAASIVTASNKTVTVKKGTKKKDPIIKEGCPLPDNGICKHYKKSYRWLRFPCCGRLYPCDVCHDEKENDHDMKYASRMVCGFCSKEQPYSKEKPCFSCSANMTKKPGCYWEGGQGCRNSVTMSRKDAHKYSGMSKTTSKKSQPMFKKKK